MGDYLRFQTAGGRIVVCLMLVMLLVGCGGREEKKKAPSASGREAAGNQVTDSAISGAAAGEEISLEDRSRHYAEQIAGGILTELWDTLSPELAAQLTQEGLQASWNSVAGNIGAYEEIEEIQNVENGSYRIVVVILRFRQNQGRSIRFVYDQEGQVAGIWFDVAEISQKTGESGALGTWSEEELSLGREPYPLQGKLTLPEKKEPPVVILLADASDADMDGTMGQSANKPLSDIAHGLAERGIASVRYHRRSYEYGAAVSPQDSLYDTLFQDVWYVVDQMYNERRIDRGRIYILAMGKTADYMPAIVKKKAKRLSGAILMAGSPVAVTERYYAREEKTITSDAAYFMEKNSTFPLLVLQGEEDFQVTMNDFQKWKDIWKGRSHIVYRSYQHLNHYFMLSSGEKSREEYDRSGTVNTSVIRDIARWCEETGA